MIGTNHHVEAGFMDQLPMSLRDAAVDLLNFYRLKQLVDMARQGPFPEVIRRFDHQPHHWQKILRAVILTKVSYFTITADFPNAYINKLLEIAAFALAIPGAKLGAIYKAVERDYPFFARWLKNIHEIKLMKYKQAQQQQT